MAESVRPPTSIEPRSGRWTPVSILTSVLLPDPFSPMIAWTSPARRSKVHACTACVGPKALARSTVRSANVPLASIEEEALTRRLAVRPVAALSNERDHGRRT